MITKDCKFENMVYSFSEPDLNNQFYCVVNCGTNHPTDDEWNRFLEATFTRINQGCLPSWLLCKAMDIGGLPHRKQVSAMKDLANIVDKKRHRIKAAIVVANQLSSKMILIYLLSWVAMLGSGNVAKRLKSVEAAFDWLGLQPTEIHLVHNTLNHQDQLLKALIVQRQLEIPTDDN